MNIAMPYLLFIGDSEFVKTARGVRDWRPEQCIAQYRHASNPVSLDLPDTGFDEAFKAGARTMLLGAAPPGGGLPEHWVDDVCKALRAGLDIASGLHDRLNAHPVIKPLADELGRTLWDVRSPEPSYPFGTFERRPGKRLLTVGTDCAVGKKYTALAIEQEMTARGLDATFRATGQTGILIAGGGIPIDSVVADFIAAAAAQLSPPAEPAHWDVIEGQGSLFHPAYAGVTLGLLHGSQPDALVLCTDPTRTGIGAFEHYPQPDLQEAVRRYTEAGALTNPDIEVIGVSMNTSAMGEDEARELLEREEARLGLPCVDPIRLGVGRIVDRLAG
ncbi:DUF1611 domain-containing protein [Henriciella aquimarina]|uniref:DUF1611 domain-containing protein n=1 Tax=Henriciella aquimarina TaxID=545261 RepID=UPI0009FFFF0D|nr:DUF1611 domain-containing protein [Henriciella aquimarina]